MLKSFAIKQTVVYWTCFWNNLITFIPSDPLNCFIRIFYRVLPYFYSIPGFGNFDEIGPLDENLNPRESTWVKDCNVLFIDNPVGTGFSYVENSNLLTTNNKQIALDLVEVMKQFYNQLPEFEETPLYIMSESYGGKMTAEFALELTKAVKAGQITSNLVGK